MTSFSSMRSLLLPLILLLGGFTIAARAAAADRPHIVVILADDMGIGDPGCYNPQSKIPTPHIDRLAREGLRFTDAHAPGPLCVPSRYGLLTGRHPFRPGAVGGGARKPLIGDDQPTLASVLRARGYRTAMVGKWHLGFEEKGFDQVLRGGPVDRGFDTFFGFRASTDIPPYFYIAGDRAVVPPTDTIAESAAHPGLGYSPIQGAFWRGGGIAPGLKLADVLPRLGDEAVRAIDDHARARAATPLFLYFALTGPHTPWLPAAEFKDRSGAGTYGDFSAMVDAIVGRVLRALDDTGLARDTLVVFTSDNGPVWYPEDVQRTGHDSAGGWRGMKNSHWEAGHRMPFIVRWPGRVQPGGTSAHLLAFTDLMATFAELTGAPLPADAGPDSFSFLPALLGKKSSVPVRESLVIGRSIRSGPWKWIDGHEPIRFAQPGSPTEPPSGQPPGLLYHLGDDPGETKNLAATRPEIVARLNEEMARIKAATRTRP
jgi:arylsulfatase A-like enzyme